MRTHPVDSLLEQYCYKSAAGLLQLVCVYFKLVICIARYLPVCCRKYTECFIRIWLQFPYSNGAENITQFWKYQNFNSLKGIGHKVVKLKEKTSTNLCVSVPVGKNFEDSVLCGQRDLEKMLSNILLYCICLFYTSTTEINQSFCCRCRCRCFCHRIKGISNWKNDAS